jgi:hypothetical protein
MFRHEAQGSGHKAKNITNETPRSKLRGISTKDISNNNAASSGVFTQRENKNNQTSLILKLNAKANFDLTILFHESSCLSIFTRE